MPKFQFGPYSDLDANITARVGSAANAGGRLTDNDCGKFVKLVADSRYSLCAAGDLIEGVLNAIEPATQDGYAIGTVNKGGESRLSCICDGLQATPGTGTIAVGDYVVCGTVVAAGTAMTSTTGPKVCKATYQPTIANTAGDTVAVSTLSIPIDMTVVASGAIMTAITPGYSFELMSAELLITKAVTGSGATAELSMTIGSDAVTGGVVTPTLASGGTLGAVIAGTAITSGATGSASDTLTLTAGTVTAFTAGSAVLMIKIKNLDTITALTQVGAISNGVGWRVVSLGNAGAVADTCVIELHR